MTDKPEYADVIVDDIIASGKTRDKYKEENPSIPFIALIENPGKEWYVFPWEVEGGQDKSTEDIFVRLLEYIGEDPKREGLIETPKRMAKAWKEWTSGYSEDPKEVLKTFEDGAEGYGYPVIVKDIPIYSHCEHHLAAIIGHCSIGYIPNGRIVGLSKLARVAEIYSRRLQVQERLTKQICDCIWEVLKPQAVTVEIRARHMCMESRGVRKPGSMTFTCFSRGIGRINLDI